MEQPFGKMADEGIPKCNDGADTSGLKPEEPKLPPLSAKDFRIYNGMSEHMNMFVSLAKAPRRSGRY